MLPPLRFLVEALWTNYFKQPLDSIKEPWVIMYSFIREQFFETEWYRVYDFLEFVVANYHVESINAKFIDTCNKLFEKEVAAYRFVGGRITQITSKDEIAEIDEAMKASNPLKPVNEHLKSGLEHLSNRKSPDYRNSIKESISAVEAICRLVTNEEKATLGVALDLIEKQGKVKLHPALKGAFDKLYGYTSASDGIRHAMLEESNLDFEDAKFMLVSCSAFVNYLLSKSAKANMKLAKR
jgi:hypothetical protein